jgi:Raf kinase inhibitor-like YbhB/YbcL family protein
LPDDIPIGKMKNVGEKKRAERRRFLKYTASAVVVAAAAAGGYYALTTQAAPGTSSSTTTTVPTMALTPRISQRTTEASVGLIVTSQAFKSGESIPSKYACDGEDVSPPISWSGASEQTKSYALIVNDLDAPTGTFTHWVIFNIPAADTDLQEGVPTVGTLSNGATQGRNGFGKIGYGGPCPPSGRHRYVFHVYALDTLLNLQAGASQGDVLEAMNGHILAEGELTGLYSKG